MCSSDLVSAARTWLLKKRTNGSVRYCQYTSDSGDNCEKNMCQESRLPGKRPLAAQLLDMKAELKGSREDVRKLQSLARHDGKVKK